MKRENSSKQQLNKYRQARAPIIVQICLTWLLLFPLDFSLSFANSGIVSPVTQYQCTYNGANYGTSSACLQQCYGNQTACNSTQGSLTCSSWLSVNNCQTTPYTFQGSPGSNGSFIINDYWGPIPPSNPPPSGPNTACGTWQFSYDAACNLTISTVSSNGCYIVPPSSCPSGSQGPHCANPNIVLPLSPGCTWSSGTLYYQSSGSAGINDLENTSYHTINWVCPYDGSNCANNGCSNNGNFCCNQSFPCTQVLVCPADYTLTNSQCIPASAPAFSIPVIIFLAAAGLYIISQRHRKLDG